MSQTFDCQRTGCERHYTVGGRVYDGTTKTWTDREITREERTYCPQHRGSGELGKLQQTAPTK
ncbi:hypothetical protein LCGC14_1570550 [marine sediment metagenome]|uniref:Uncharacterized protein n=1 Tax=marine sediment metagenome TaxID=412755 RepID=A0A0F9LK67_9ZZZZ